MTSEICARLSTGEPMTVICRDLGVNPSTVWDWAQGDKVLSQQIARARDDGFDAIAADCLKIADDGTADYVQTDDGPALDKEHIQRSKLRVHTRLQLLAKWDPKRYGERIQQEVTVTDTRSERLARARERAGK